MTLLAKMKRYLKKDVALLIYKTMLLPYLDYADVIFNNSNSGDLQKLQKLQNRCLRICLGFDARFNTDRAHKLASTPFLSDRRKAHVCNFMYVRKSRTNLLNNMEIRTRAHDAPLLHIKVPRCKAFKRSVGYFGSDMWNNLGADMRNIDSYLLFNPIDPNPAISALAVFPQSGRICPEKRPFFQKFPHFSKKEPTKE